MHFYSIHVIAEYNLSGSEIICRQIVVIYLLAHVSLLSGVCKAIRKCALQWESFASEPPGDPGGLMFVLMKRDCTSSVQ